MRNQLYLLLAVGFFISCNRKESEPVDCNTLREIDGIWRVSDDEPYTGKCTVVQKGVIQAFTEYKEGKLDRKTCFYYANGQLKEEVAFIEGISHGSVTYFYKNGRKELIGQTANGMKQGEWIKYFPDGRIMSKNSFKNSKENGTLIEYFANGVLKTTGKFDMGIKDGDWMYYDSISGRRVGLIRYEKGKVILVKDL